MPAINRLGGLRSALKGAVEDLEQVRDPHLYFRKVAEYAQRNRMKYTPLQWFPSEKRLALEMASQEEAERRAIVDGELAQLESDWRQAEEIAAIADNLFLPAEISDWIDRAR